MSYIEKIDILSNRIEIIRAETEKMKAVLMLEGQCPEGMGKIQKLENDMMDCLIQIQELETYIG